jgi:ABC-type oligopeptide transport system ATPase subunit
MMCIPTARQRLCKNIPAGDNARNNRTSVAKKRIRKRLLNNIGCFLPVPCKMVIKKCSAAKCEVKSRVSGLQPAGI